MTVLTMTFFLATTSLVLGVFAIVLYHVKRSHFYKLASSLPGPPTLPLVGNAHEFLGTSTKDIIKIISSYLKRYPSLFRLWFGPFLVVFVDDAKYVKTLMIGHKLMEKSYHYTFVKPFLGTGLLTISAEKWRAHRRLLQPAFNQSVLENFMTIFTSNAKIMVQRMELDSKDREIDVYRYASLYTLESIYQTSFGLKQIEEETNTIKFKEAFDTLMIIIANRFLKVWLYPDVLFNMSPDGKKYRSIGKNMHQHSDRLIRETKKNLLRENRRPHVHDEDENATDSPRRKVLLEMLLEMRSNGKKQLSDEQIRYDVNTMLAAGHDTTAGCINFLMLVLATYPDVQEHVYQELCQIYGNGDNFERDITAEDLKKMDYLERVIKETLRLLPVVPFIGREVPTNLDIGDYHIPKGATVMIGVLSLHRNDKYWLNPMKFDPDRFLPEEVAKRHSHAYIPFGAGPRICIGWKHAIMSLKVICATILRRNIVKKDKVVPLEDIELQMDITLKPTKEITIRLERRR